DRCNDTMQLEHMKGVIQQSRNCLMPVALPMIGARECVADLGLAAIFGLDLHSAVADQLTAAFQFNRKLKPLAWHAWLCKFHFVEKEMRLAFVDRGPTLIARHLWIVAIGDKGG